MPRKRIGMKLTNTQTRRQAGSIVVEILVVTVFLMIIIYALVDVAGSVLHRGRGRIFGLQAQYAAESGADSAIAQLNNVSDTYSGTSSEVNLLTTTQFKATYSTTVANGSTSK